LTPGWTLSASSSRQLRFRHSCYGGAAAADRQPCQPITYARRQRGSPTQSHHTCSRPATHRAAADLDKERKYPNRRLCTPRERDVDASSASAARQVPPGCAEQPPELPRGGRAAGGLFVPWSRQAPADEVFSAAGRALQRQAWNWALASRAGDGSLPSGREIARQYGRHERWGRLVKSSGRAGAFGIGGEPGLRVAEQHATVPTER
jgi:hypothetical protein